ncbi:MAG: hypothetical protein HZB40_05305 [Rhodocyclales bacterium]|nr:hypothetical protein [Rhodocyclales bacterium]
MTADSAFEILAEAKKLAQRYRALTDKPLGITGEVPLGSDQLDHLLEFSPPRHQLGGKPGLRANGTRQ